MDSKCQRCTNSKCCTYMTEAIGEAPRSKSDFEHLLWQVSHAGVEIYKDDDGWFLLVKGDCEHLQPNGGCGIYETRPQICRDYENDWCEFDAPAEDSFELYFRNHAEMLTYCKRRFKSWGR